MHAFLSCLIQSTQWHHVTFWKWDKVYVLVKPSRGANIWFKGTLSDQGTFTAVGAQGGFHGTPLKNTSPFPHWNFAMPVARIYVWTIKNHNSAKKSLKMLYSFQNGGQITNFYFASFRFLETREKRTFSKEFFNEIWLKVGKHKYMLHYWNNIVKKCMSVFKLAAKKIFFILRNNANLC